MEGRNGERSLIDYSDNAYSAVVHFSGVWNWGALIVPELVTVNEMRVKKSKM